MSFLMQLDTDMFVDLLLKAMEQETGDRLWEKWLAELPNMNKENFIPFDDYKDKHFEKDTSTKKSDEEILNDAENILKSISKPK